MDALATLATSSDGASLVSALIGGLVVGMVWRAFALASRRGRG